MLKNKDAMPVMIWNYRLMFTLTSLKEYTSKK
jgi:hypothetical protein